MTAKYLIASLLTLGSVRAAEVDRQQLMQLIEAAQKANYQDVSFDYEGKWVAVDPPAPDRVVLVYTGTLNHRADGATRLDIYNFEPEEQRASHGIVAELNGTTTSSSRRADEKNAHIAVSKQGPLQFAGLGSFRQVWLADLVNRFCLSDYFYQFDGFRQLDGADCAVVRFRLVTGESVATTPEEKTVSEVFWIDLNRGGHVIRRETWIPGRKLSLRTTVKLQQVPGRSGKSIWVPFEGKVEQFARMSKERKVVYLDYPESYLFYSILASSIKIDQNMPDDVFAIQAKSGDLVSDEVRKARYEFGQYMIRPSTKPHRPTDAETKAELDRMLRDSQVMANELKATSPAQEASSWWGYWPWVVAGAALVGIAVVGYRGRGE